MEAQSTDTEKNIAYSARFIPDKNAKIGVVSNDFHLFRAGMLVRAKGFHNVSTIAARSDEVLFLNYRVREYFGVLKEALIFSLSFSRREKPSVLSGRITMTFFSFSSCSSFFKERL